MKAIIFENKLIVRYEEIGAIISVERNKQFKIYVILRNTELLLWTGYKFTTKEKAQEQIEQIVKQLTKLC